MTPEQALILSVLSSQLQNTPAQTLPETTETDWSSTLQDLHAHAVSLLFFSSLDRLQLPVPSHFYKQCSVLARRITARNLRNEHLQRQLVDLLEQKYCPYVILKGEAAAAYYPEPELRQLGDVDFMVPPQYADEIIEAFKNQGFEHSCEEAQYHQILKNGSRWMELHFEPAGIPEGPSGQLVRSFFRSVFEESLSVSDDFGSYRIPGHAHHGLILLLHMQHHMTDLGLGLRHLIDWACFVHKTREQTFWEERLLPLLKQIGLFHYAAVITKLCALYLHSPCPPWACYPDDALCHALMEDVLASGSFGNKDKVRTRSCNMLPNRTKDRSPEGKLSLLYETLRNSAIKDRPHLENKAIRLFFVMAYKACRYLVLSLFGKRPNLLKAAGYATAREAIYQQLKIFKTEQ